LITYFREYIPNRNFPINKNIVVGQYVPLYGLFDMTPNKDYPNISFFTLYIMDIYTLLLITF